MTGSTLSKKCALLMVKLQSPSLHFIQSTCCSVSCRPGLGKRAVTELERKHLVETDRHIAECKNYIDASLSEGRFNTVVPRKWRRQR
jgi:hypothetical protein